MRSYLPAVLAAMVLLPVPAAACPERAHCLTRLAIDAVDETPAATPPPATLEVKLAADVRPVLDRELAIHRAPRKPAVEMPWIWQVLVREVYDRLPTYRERQFTMTLSPVVVAGSFDTVPGVGFAGDF